MNDKVTYHQQVSYCGKARCRKCREGQGHGPYWYAYRTVNGRTTRTYVGKHLPAEALAVQEGPAPTELAPATLVATLDRPASVVQTLSVRIFALGQFRLERRAAQAWRAVDDSVWQRRRVRMLLALLLCRPGRKVQRSEALALLWPKSEPGVAGEELEKLISLLRNLLEPTRGRSRSTPASHVPLLRSDGDWLLLADQSRIWVDADAFEELLNSVELMPEATGSIEVAEDAFPSEVHVSANRGEAFDQRERLLQEAAALYGGDFLPEGRHNEWVTVRRQLLRRRWLGLLLELADLYIQHGDSSRAISVLDHLLANDPAHEGAVQRLIVVLARLNRRGEALGAYRQFTAVLQREFKMVPSEETRVLYETIRVGNVPAAYEPASAPALPALAKASVASSESAVSPPEEVQSSRALRIGRSHQSPLVGRTLELETLRQMIQAIDQDSHVQLAGLRRLSGIPLDTQRQPQCAVLLGDSGIGKTRLAEELARDARRRDWSVIWSRMYLQESNIPYRLWIDALRKAVELVPALAASGVRPPSLATSSLELTQLQALTTLLPELEDALPQTQYALPGQTVGLQSARSSALSAHLLPEQEQQRLWEAIRDLFIMISESGSLMIVLDDIQWADASSYDLLGYLARSLYGYPILLVCTCRDTELPKQPPHPLRVLISHMLREHSVRTLEIAPLTSEQIAQLVAHLPEPMVQHIQAQAAGNPLFAEELARTTPPTLPKSIVAALAHRMGKLSEPCRLLLGNAAVLGGFFEFPVICAMESDNDRFDEDAVLTLLEEALQSGVLTEEGSGTRIIYHFWHPLLVSYLYDDLTAMRRLRLHRQAALVLQQMYRQREEDVAATIVHHLVKGGADSNQIVRYAEMAADRAYALSAYTEAEHHYWLASEHTTSSASQERRAYLLERLAECTLIRGKFEEARHLYQRVLDLRTFEPTLSPYEVQHQALLWGEIGWTWRYMGDSARARVCCERGEQVLREASILVGPAWARLRYEQSSLYLYEGNYAEARRTAQEALTLFQEQDLAEKVPAQRARSLSITRIQRTLNGDPVDLGQTYKALGDVASGEGRRTEALEMLNTALAIFEQYEHKRRIAHVSCNLGYVYLKKGEYTLAQSSLRRSLNLAESLGDAPLSSVVFSNLGELAATTGDLEEAEALYKKAIGLAERFNDREYMSKWNAGLAAVLQDLHKFEDAAACIRQALSIGRSMRNTPCIGVALVALGNLRVKLALASEASAVPKVRERCLSQARRDVQRALDLPGLEAETRTKGQLVLAHISLLQGATGQARTALGTILEEARRYELALLETDARRLLAGL